jgi:hypothetical protein
MKRLYVVVRDDLTKSQKTVQSIHAASEYLLKENGHGWSNGTVVCLKVRNEFELNILTNKLKKENINYRTFFEPDLNNSLTAIALVSENKMFDNLTLL